MSRNPALEALLQAKFDLDTCADDQQHFYRKQFEKLLDLALAKSPLPQVSRVKLQEERAKLSRLR